MKLRVLYGSALSSDKDARRRKLWVLCAAGIGVYFPFLFITYSIFMETRAFYLAVMGFLAALVCVPVVWYAYAKGYGRSLLDLRRERGKELGWLAVKIGFFYGFELFWMVLGIVEFLLGYHAFRAALISFVAVAVARDGFEIGYYRSGRPGKTISVFPDGLSFWAWMKEHSGEISFFGAMALAGGGLLGAAWAPFVQNPKYQTCLAGLSVGILSTAAYVKGLRAFPPLLSALRFFAWPGFTMACTYFLIFAYLLRVVFGVRLPPVADQTLLIALVALLMVIDGLFLGHLKGELSSRRTDWSENPGVIQDPVKVRFER